MRFMLNRNRTISSTCGLSIEFKKGELHLVPPSMYEQVIAAGGTPEVELTEEELPPKTATPEALEAREAAMFKAFEAIATRNVREEFTAGGMPHNSVVARETGFAVSARDRDAAWLKFMAKED